MRIRILLLTIVVLAVTISCKKDDITNPTPNSNCTDPITIGSQVWMCKNLDVDHYRNGDPIPEVKDSVEWTNLSTGAWCYYNNDPALGAIYGKLYNLYAVNDQRGLAPTGWHVPSDEEWTTLSTYLGGKGVAGDKMKEAGTTHWWSPNTGATNSSGFSALPGGYRNFTVQFKDIGFNGSWWSSTEDDTSNVWYRYLFYKNAGINRSLSVKNFGFSVRCVKD